MPWREEGIAGMLTEWFGEFASWVSEDISEGFWVEEFAEVEVCVGMRPWRDLKDV